MIDKERGLQLLGSGLGPTDVATALGCDPSFVSQWLMDENFRAQVLAKRIESLQAQTKRDQKIDGIEDALIEKLQESVQWLTKPKDILLAFNILNNAKRRGATASGQINLTQNVVTINMPPVARQHYFPKTNAQGEVVQVGDQVTVTKSLQQLMAERVTKQIKSAQDVEVLSEQLSPEGHGSTKEGRKQTAAV